MKKILAGCLALSLLVTGCMKPEPQGKPEPIEEDMKPVVHNSTSLWDTRNESGAFDLSGKHLTLEDLSQSLENLLQSDFDTMTRFPELLPHPFNPDQILDRGMKVGLSIRSVHDSGIDGEGVGIAIIDKPLYKDHVAYRQKIAHYEKVVPGADHYSKHTSALASITVGDDMGIAPEALIHYFDIGTDAPTHEIYTQAIHKAVDHNETLKAAEKIRVIAIANTLSTQTPFPQTFEDAMKRAHEAGIEVIYHGMENLAGIGRNPLLEPDYTGAYQKLVDTPPDALLVPVGGITITSHTDPRGYEFSRYGDQTWTVPYVAALYALACQLKPEITLEDFWKLAKQTSETVETESNDVLEGMFHTWHFFHGLAPEYEFAWQSDHYTPKKDEGKKRTARAPLSPFDIVDRHFVYSANLFDPSLMLHYTFDTTNIFEGSEDVAADIIETRKNPGLGVRELHARGITGKGVNVGIIDQPILLNHPEYKDQIRAYINLDENVKVNETSYHGPAVTGILAGKTTGVAPDVGIYYVAVPSWYGDVQYYADGLLWIIEENKKLPIDEKIRIVSVSTSPSNKNKGMKNGESWTQAVALAEAEGIYVIDCREGEKTQFVYSAFTKSDDIDEPTHYQVGYPNLYVGFEEDSISKVILAPASYRTIAQQYTPDTFDYRYESAGGVSWAVPYVAGVFALGWQIDPDATFEELKALMFQTAKRNSDRFRVVTPIAFIEAVEAQR